MVVHTLDSAVVYFIQDNNIGDIKGVHYWHFQLQWRHNERDGVSNHQHHDSLLNSSLGRRSKKASKLRVTGFCEGNSPYKWPITRNMFLFDDVIMVKGKWFKVSAGCCFQNEIALHEEIAEEIFRNNLQWPYRYERIFNVQTIYMILYKHIYGSENVLIILVYVDYKLCFELGLHS